MKFVGAMIGLEVLLSALYVMLVFGGGLFGIAAYAIESGSMSPSMSIGALVYVDENVRASEIAPGEIVAFKIDGANTEVCTHRVVANDIESQSICTKGDSNKEIDATPIPYASIVGRVVISIPYMGFIARIISSNRFVVVGVYGGILIVTSALYCLVDRSVKQKRYSKRGNTYGIKRCNT